MNNSAEDRAKYLIAELSDRDETVRREAVEKLGEAKARESVGALVRLMAQEKDSGVLDALGGALSAIGGEETVGELLPLLASDAARIRNLVCETLVNIGETAVPRLTEHLSHPDGDIRKFVADVLGEIGSRRGVQALVKALNDDNINVACSVAESLGKIGDAGAVEALMAAARAGNPDKGYYAIMALGKIKDPRAMGFLEETLRNNGSLLKYAAIEALGGIGNAQAAKLLKGLMGEKDVMSWKLALKGLGRTGLHHLEEAFRGNGDETVRERVIAALKDSDREMKKFALITLGCLDGSPVTGELIRILEESDEFTSFVIQVLVKMGRKDIRPLLPLLDNPHIRRTILVALGDVQDAGSAGAIIALTRDPDAQVRVAAVLTLGKLAQQGTLEAIAAALRDPDDEVRSAAATALGWFKDPRALRKLLPLFTDKAAVAADAAADSIVMIGGGEAVRILLEASKDARGGLRARAARALGMMPTDGKIRRLLVQLVKDKEAPVRKAAVIGLMSYHDAPLSDEIEPAFKDADPEVRMAAVKLAARLDESRARALLENALDDTSVWVRYEAILALGASCSKKGFQKLMRILIEGEGVEQIAVCKTLGETRYADARPLLTRLLESENPDVRDAAQKALDLMRAR